MISLPEPDTAGKMPLEEAVQKRRSVRQFGPQELTMEQIGQLLWAAQGVTDTRGFRTAPSAGALYPLEIYLVKKDGVFRYAPDGHSLEPVRKGDARKDLAAAALGQPSVAQAPVSIVIAAVESRVSKRYGARARRYVDIEVGHAAQNVHLEAVALGLASVPVGAFSDADVKKVLDLSEGEEPLYIIPAGYAK